MSRFFLSICATLLAARAGAALPTPDRDDGAIKLPPGFRALVGYHFSTGHRHILSLAHNSVSRSFFIVMMGRDQLKTVAPEYYTDEHNAEAPAEELHIVREGGSPGAKVYLEICAKCHMVDGSGVPNMQPALTSRGLLSGDASTLIRLVLFGPAKVLPPNRPAYENPMPELSTLTDKEIADALNYARRTFGKVASSIEPKDVAALRAKP